MVMTTETLAGGRRPTHCMSCGVKLPDEPPAGRPDICRFGCGAPVYRMKPGPVCSKCGHPDGLMVLNANNQPVHEGVCWGEPMPEPVGALIAHDPLGSGGGREVRAGTRFVVGYGGDDRALARLRELGAGHRKDRFFRNPVASEAVVIDNPSGRSDGKTREYEVDPLAYQSMQEVVMVAPRAGGDVPAVGPGAAVPIGSSGVAATADDFQKPLIARRRRPSVS